MESRLAGVNDSGGIVHLIDNIFGFLFLKKFIGFVGSKGLLVSMYIVMFFRVKKMSLNLLHIYRSSIYIGGPTPVVSYNQVMSIFKLSPV